MPRPPLRLLWLLRFRPDREGGANGFLERKVDPEGVRSLGQLSLLLWLL
jgi:hypothetical protein